MSAFTVISPPAATTAPPPPTALGDEAIEQLATRYTFRRPAEVTGYLRQFPYLIPTLTEATAVVPRYFGPNTPLVLDLFVDPESELETTELYAFIQTDLAPLEAVDRLDQFDQEWWTMAERGEPGALVISLEFR